MLETCSVAMYPLSKRESIIESPQVGPKNNKPLFLKGFVSTKPSPPKKREAAARQLRPLRGV